MGRSSRGKGRSSVAPGNRRSSGAPTLAEIDQAQENSRYTFDVSPLPAGVNPGPKGLRAILAVTEQLPASGEAGAGQLDHDPFSPPRLTGGEVNPPERRNEGSPGEFHKLVMTDSGVRLIPLQRPCDGEKCVIDWLSFTCSESVLREVVPEEKPFSDDEYCKVWAEYFTDSILLLDAKYKANKGGLFSYDASGRIGDYAMVAAGAGGNLFIQVYGHAFACADQQFPQRLYQFLTFCRSAKITRIDIAYDDLDGELFNVRNVPARWQRGDFTSQRSPTLPAFTRAGQWDEDDPRQLGLTAYIGSRQSGKYLRIYEKGRELGQKDSPWVRAEVELKGDVFHLIPEMLLRPTSFFVAICPAFAMVATSAKPDRLKRVASEGFATITRLLAIIRHQYGGHLKVLRENFFQTDSELLDHVCRDTANVSPVLRRALNLSTVLSKADSGVADEQAIT